METFVLSLDIANPASILLEQKKFNCHQSLVMLQATTEIAEGHPLKGVYSLEENRLDAVTKAQISILNATVNQQRIVFCLTKQKVNTLAANDSNWSKPGFDNNNYKALIKKLTESDCVLLWKGQGPAPSIYQLINSGVLELINADTEAQKQECVDFVNRKLSKKISVADLVPHQTTEPDNSNRPMGQTGVQTALPDTEGRSKNEEDRIKKIEGGITSADNQSASVNTKSSIDSLTENTTDIFSGINLNPASGVERVKAYAHLKRLQVKYDRDEFDLEQKMEQERDSNQMAAIKKHREELKRQILTISQTISKLLGVNSSLSDFEQSKQRRNLEIKIKSMAQGLGIPLPY